MESCFHNLPSPLCLHNEPKNLENSRYQKDWRCWNFLVVQWLGFHALKAGDGMGSILGQGTRSHMYKLGVHNLQLEIPKQTKIFFKSLRKMKMLLK